ncbi:polysaccharide biosynthesis protein [Natrinema altunense JCM 12890]|uniref:Polysaccharide biosynthesis protein n=1 Tax=Natrinema altunense (strain JCM 12890 / CGMCC 1.3731 / AJ2) TaxID=1227494 RepID=L9ZL69_NATA2|nr:polysaccharide biosynthesis protein [Natrinema altunense JCM 12890]
MITQAQYGLYASVLAAFSIVALISKGGLFDATRKTIAEHASQSDEVSSILSVSLLLSTVYAILIMSLMLFTLRIGFIPSTYVPYILVLTGAILFENIFTIVRGTFYGLKKESIAEVLNISRRFVYLVSGLALAYVGYDVLGVFTGYMVSFFVLCILGLIALMKHSSYRLPKVRDIRKYGRKIASFGGYQLIGGLSAVLLYRADILLVGYFQGSTSTALYQSAIVPAEMIWFLPSAIQLAFLQHTATLWSDGKIDEINENIKIGVKYAVLSLTLFGVGLFGLTDPFLHVYFGPEYASASTTLQVLIFGTFFFGITRVVVPVLQATGWVRHTELITVGALFLNLLLNLILIPRYGIIGAGVGTGISYISIFIGNTAVWKRSPFELVSLIWVCKLVTVQGVFAVLFLTTVSLLNFSPLISLLLFPPVGLLMFLAINMIAGYVPTERVLPTVSWW